MKKRYILVLFLAFMLIGVNAEAQITTWKELYDKFQNGGNITLTQDITYSGSKGALVVPSGKTVTLDLNGYKIDRQLTSATKEGSVIQVKGTLIINDSKGGGIITGGYVDRDKDIYDGGGGLYIYKGGEVTLNSGSIYGNKSYGKGPGVLICPGAKMTMNGGSISYNVNTRLDSAGGVYVQGSSSGGGAVFTMYDGEISHNIGGHGGGVYVDGESSSSKAVFYLHGGMICYNEANGWGGGVCARSDGYFYMYGGYVFNNHAYTDGKYAGIGGGIFLEGGAHVDIEISAGTKMGIYENTAQVEGDDIESDSGATLNLISPEQMTKVDGNIYFGGKSKWITDVEGNRFRDGKGSVASKQSGEITTGASLAISIPCPWCDLQEQIDNAPNNVSTTITLTGDITANLSEHFHLGTKKDSDIRLLVPANKIIVLNLNGHKLDRNLTGKDAMVDGNVLSVAEGASLTIKDSSMDADNPYGKGIITGGNHSSEGGAIYNDGSFVLENGNITGNHTTDIGGALFNAGELLMKNGSISGNITDYCGGGLVNKGILTVTGGIITGNKALGTEYGGGGIYNDAGCTVTISNCTISSNQSDLGGAIQNMGMGTVTMTNSEIADNIARLNGNGIFQMGVMNLGSGNTFGKDQIVYLPAGADAAHKSQYVITKIGSFSSKVPVTLENEVTGRDILVSKAGAAGSSQGQVTNADLELIDVALKYDMFKVIYNEQGHDSGVTPKDVIELFGKSGIIINRTNLPDGVSSVYNVFKDGSSTPLFVVSLNGKAGEEIVSCNIVDLQPGTYEVREMTWNWTQDPEATKVEPAEKKVESGAGYGKGLIIDESPLVFTFGGASKDNTQKHGEDHMVNNLAVPTM